MAEAFKPQSFKQIKKEYMETPFWLSSFGSGSQLTIVEDLPMTKPLRYKMTKSNKGGGDYAENLIRITDGYTEKDLSVSKRATQQLLLNIPENITNLKGITLANNNGRWEFVCQTDESMNAGFKPSQPQYDQKDTYLKMVVNAMKTCRDVGSKVDIAMLMKICDGISPGNALELINKAKQEGYITESAGIFVARD